MIRWLQAIITLSLCGIAMLGFAQVQSSVYSADVVVPDHSSTALQNALPQALGQVLVKVSGNTGVVTVPSIQAALPKANQWLQSYSYQRNADGKSELVLEVNFNAKSINTLLRQAGQAIWSSDRPLLLAWIRLATPQGDQVLSSDGVPMLVSDLKQTAEKRGISLLFPAMDLQDQASMNSNSKEAFDLQKLKIVAARYGVQTILAADISVSIGQTQSQWLLYYNGQTIQWREENNSSAAMLSQGLNKAADLLANQLAVVQNTNLSTNVNLEITHVDDLQTYNKVIKQLRHLRTVANVSVTDMSGGNLLLEVRVVGGQEALANALRSQPQFQPIAQPLQAGTQQVPVDLYYRWVE